MTGVLAPASEKPSESARNRQVAQGRDFFPVLVAGPWPKFRLLLRQVYPPFRLFIVQSFV